MLTLLYVQSLILFLFTPIILIDPRRSKVLAQGSNIATHRNTPPSSQYLEISAIFPSNTSCLYVRTNQRTLSPPNVVVAVYPDSVSTFQLERGWAFTLRITSIDVSLAYKSRGRAVGKGRMVSGCPVLFLRLLCQLSFCMTGYTTNPSKGLPPRGCPGQRDPVGLSLPQKCRCVEEELHITMRGSDTRKRVVLFHPIFGMLLPFSKSTTLPLEVDSAL